MNDVPLHGGETAPSVNFLQFELIDTDKQGNERVVYRNSWVTDHVINADNAVTLVQGARCRWKIENECFNTLKNQGYFLEHSYGHGSQYLCFNVYLLTLLAFFFHQIFELTCAHYQACRVKCVSKHYFWENIKSLHQSCYLSQLARPISMYLRSWPLSARKNCSASLIFAEKATF